MTFYCTIQLSHNCPWSKLQLLFIVIVILYLKMQLSYNWNHISCNCDFIPHIRMLPYKPFDLSLVKLYQILIVFLAYCKKKCLMKPLLVREVIEVNHVGWMQISGSLKKHAYPNSATPKHVLNSMNMVR